MAIPSAVEGRMGEPGRECQPRGRVEAERCLDHRAGKVCPPDESSHGERERCVQRIFRSGVRFIAKGQGVPGLGGIWICGGLPIFCFATEAEIWARGRGPTFRRSVAGGIVPCESAKYVYWQAHRNHVGRSHEESGGTGWLVTTQSINYDFRYALVAKLADALP